MDLKTITARLQQLQTANTSQTKEKVDYTKYLWKPKAEGKYQIRFVPSKLNKANPFQEVFLHYGIGKFPIYALTNWGEKDPIVEFAKQLRATNEKDNWILAKKLDPKMRIFAPVIVRGEEDKGVRLWEFGKEIYMTLLGIAEDEDYGDFTDIDEGRDFTIDVVKGEVGGRIGLKSSIRIKPKTTPLTTDSKVIKEWLSNQPDILEIQRKQTYDGLKEVLQKYLTPDTEDEGPIDPLIEDNSEDTPTQKSSSKVKPKEKNSDKFDALFSEDSDKDEIPF